MGIKLGFKSFDKTYVSRLQGSTDTFSGVSLDDRYNYNQFDIETYKTFKIQNSLYNEVAVDITTKDYSDFDQLTITDYDFNSVRFSNSLAHKIRKGERHSLDLSYEAKIFKNREQKDVNGNEILNSDMVFNYIALAYDFNYERLRTIDIGASLSYKIRKDNASGYYNSSWVKLVLDSEYKLSKNTKIEVSYSYKDFSFDREPTLDLNGNDDELGSDTKHEFQLASKTRLPNWVGKRSYWGGEYSYLTADANYPKYTFDRHQLKTSLRVVF
jgi:hypothetical protein